MLMKKLSTVVVNVRMMMRNVDLPVYLISATSLHPALLEDFDM
jgi:hypothetical protein